MANSSMVPCKSIRYWMTWFCVLPTDDSCPTWQKSLNVVFTISIYLFNIIATTTSFLYFLAYFDTDLQNALYSMYPVIAFVATTYGVTIFHVYRRETFALFEHLDEIYRTNNDDELFELISCANEKCESLWLTIFMNICVIGFHSATFVMTTLSLAICYYTKGHFDTNLLYHPHHEILPWNQTSLHGYTLEISLYTVDSATYLISYCLLLVLFISMCKHHLAFNDFFCSTVKKLETSDRHHHENLLCKIIRFHGSVKAWFLESAEIYSLIVLIQLIASMFLMACGLFQLDMQLQNTTFDVVDVIFQVVIAITNLFCYCYYGKLATQSYETLADSLFECNWQKMSVRFQKYLIVMIQNAQEPIYYHGFGIAVLDLETFMRLLRNVITYYMLFKTLTE